MAEFAVIFAEGVGERAHIPQRRGGAPGWTFVCCRRAKMGGEGEDGGGRDERRRTKINRDLVDGGLKLRSPLKIVFDINTCKFDK